MRSRNCCQIRGRACLGGLLPRVGVALLDIVQVSLPRGLSGQPARLVLLGHVSLISCAAAAACRVPAAADSPGARTRSSGELRACRPRLACRSVPASLAVRAPGAPAGCSRSDTPSGRSDSKGPNDERAAQDTRWATSLMTVAAGSAIAATLTRAAHPAWPNSCSARKLP